MGSSQCIIGPSCETSARLGGTALKHSDLDICQSCFSTRIHFGFTVVAGCFAFIITSCLFKTFFSSFSSILVFLGSAYLCLKAGALGNQPLFNKIGMILFCLIFTSIFWSDNDLLQSLRFLSEYRSFLLIPLVGFSFYIARSQSVLAACFVTGCIIALLFSYGLGLGLFKITGAELSLANRIFHGFLMSIFGYGLLVVGLNVDDNRLKFCVYLCAALSTYNIINIETGRTGYILTVVLGCLLIVLANRPVRALAGISILICSLLVAYFVFETFGSRVAYTVQNAYEFVFGDSSAVLQTSAGNRIEFYTKAFGFGLENPFFGVGVGSVEDLLRTKYELGEISVLTDNVHNEYMNMFLIGGFPGLALYISYLVAMFSYGYKFKSKQSKSLGWLFMGTAVWLGCASIFNSSIKDFGDKQLIILVLSWLVSSAMAVEKGVDPFASLRKICLRDNKQHV